MSNVNEEIYCKHCGDKCSDSTININNSEIFCCTGCKFVFELLNQSDLKEYYTLQDRSGLSPRDIDDKSFEYLDNTEIIEKLRLFSINGTAKIVLSVPQIYCTACIWLLENLYKLDSGISESRINFLRKEITIIYKEDLTSIRKIVTLLAKIGYTPKLNLADLDDKKELGFNKWLYIKLGIAGFAHGNVMLFSFPEYLSMGSLEPEFKVFIGFLNLFLSLPVIFAGIDYYISAYHSLKLKHINIDVPLSIGLIALFLRSVYDILSGTGPGFVDTFSGLTFFLLLGKVFQHKTYGSISFNRDFKSFFPLSVLRQKEEKETYVTLQEIGVGDTILIRNNEIIPVDAVLMSDTASIDYSFVTGEALPVKINKGDKIYSGGKHIGTTIKIAATKLFHQSYLTELWNNKSFKKEKESNVSRISDLAAKYFSIAILVIAFATLFYWLQFNTTYAINAFSTVLIIACPCAVSLTIPFAYGTAIRVFGKYKFYLKNDKVVESLAECDTIVFDKTGTLTDIEKSELAYFGSELDLDENSLIKYSVGNSTHPLSRLIYQTIDSQIINSESGEFIEHPGLGIECQVNDKIIKIGNYKWISTTSINKSENLEILSKAQNSPETSVFISIDNQIKGCYFIKSKFRENISEEMQSISEKFEIYILSGDNDKDKDDLIKLFRKDIPMHFNQKPLDKLHFIENLLNNNKKVIMVGDGLNDAGALKISTVGIAITDSTANFTPGSDAILESKNLNNIEKFVKLASLSVKTVYISYVLSILYNLVGLFFAVQGLLSPVIAAILMPISSVSVVVLNYLKVNYHAKKLKLKNND